MAIADSVTVSIGELTNGVFNEIFRVTLDARPTSSTPKSIVPGSTMMSSNVYPECDLGTFY